MKCNFFQDVNKKGRYLALNPFAPVEWKHNIYSTGHYGHD